MHILTPFWYFSKFHPKILWKYRTNLPLIFYRLPDSVVNLISCFLTFSFHFFTFPYLFCSSQKGLVFLSANKWEPFPPEKQPLFPIFFTKSALLGKRSFSYTRFVWALAKNGSSLCKQLPFTMWDCLENQLFIFINHLFIYTMLCKIATTACTHRVCNVNFYINKTFTTWFCQLFALKLLNENCIKLKKCQSLKPKSKSILSTTIQFLKSSYIVVEWELVNVDSDKNTNQSACTKEKRECEKKGGKCNRSARWYGKIVPWQHGILIRRRTYDVLCGASSFSPEWRGVPASFPGRLPASAMAGNRKHPQWPC